VRNCGFFVERSGVTVLCSVVVSLATESGSFLLVSEKLGWDDLCVQLNVNLRFNSTDEKALRRQARARTLLDCFTAPGSATLLPTSTRSQKVPGLWW
jgi:hypothetical protein